MKPYFLFALTIILFTSCTRNLSSQTITKKSYAYLYKIWNVDYIETGNGMKASGEALGYPTYEFTKEGKRYKRYKTPPHEEFVQYELKNDSIFFISDKKLPPCQIKTLNDSVLILQSEKATWRLIK
jgi:hypothetical protein